VLILFGNPKAGSPLMAQSPSIGIDLPLKFIAWNYLAHTILPRHGIARMPDPLTRGVDLADKLSAAEGN
jgi:hypothetical protein